MDIFYFFGVKILYAVLEILYAVFSIFWSNGCYLGMSTPVSSVPKMDTVREKVDTVRQKVDTVQIQKMNRTWSG